MRGPFLSKVLLCILILLGVVNSSVAVAQSQCARFFAQVQNTSSPEALLGAIWGGQRIAEERPACNAVEKQIEELEQAIPEVRERIERTWTEGQNFVIKASFPTRGLRLKRDAWLSFISSEWPRTLSEQCQRLDQMATADEREAEVRRIIQNDIISVLATKSLSIGQLQDSLRKNRRVLEAANYVLRENLAESPLRERFQSEDAELIYDTMDVLRRKPQLSLGKTPLPSLVSRLIARLTVEPLALPDRTAAGTASGESRFFQVRTIQLKNDRSVLAPDPGELVSFTAARERWHTAFKGVFRKECVGGGCESLRSLTPQRWASALIDGSQYFDVTKGGRWMGFVQVLPVEVNGRTYGAVEFGSDLFKARMATRAGEDSESMTSLVLARLQLQKPESWAGLIVGQSQSMARTLELDSIWSSLEYLFGQDVGTAAAARSADPLAEKIAQASSHRGYALRYGGRDRMIHDSLIRDGGVLVALAPQVQPNWSRDIKRPEVLFSLIRENRRKFSGALSYFEDHPLSKDEKETLRQALLSKTFRHGLSNEQIVLFLPAVGVDPASLSVKQPRLYLAYQRLRLKNLFWPIGEELRNRYWNLRSRIPEIKNGSGGAR